MLQVINSLLSYFSIVKIYILSLFLACWGHLEILEILCQAGADLNAKNKNDESPSDICEDPEIRERIEQLRSEQETKRLAEAQRKRVRRSQSNNTRTQSVRRTSLRDKTLTSKKDAVEEARFRLQAQEVSDQYWFCY